MWSWCPKTIQLEGYASKKTVRGQENQGILLMIRKKLKYFVKLYACMPWQQILSTWCFAQSLSYEMLRCCCTQLKNYMNLELTAVCKDLIGDAQLAYNQ